MTEENNEEFNKETEMGENSKPTPNRKPLYIALSVIGVVLAGVLLFWYLGSREGGNAVPAPRTVTFDDNSTGQATETTAEQTVTILPDQVEKIGLKIETVGETLSSEAMDVASTGVVQSNAYKETPVISLLGGVLRSVSGELGQYVGKGQTLAVIFSDELAASQSRYLALQTDVQAARQNYDRTAKLVKISPVSNTDVDQMLARLKTVQAELEENRKRHDRTLKLLEIGAVSREEFETARATAAQAQADQAAAEAVARERALDLEFTRVSAPISGRLSDRRVVRGNYVTAGQTVMTSVVSMDPIHFVFTGSEAVYLKYSRADRAGTRPSSRVAPNPVDIRLADETAYRWRGQMDFVDNALDEGTGTIRGRAVVRNPSGFLTPGMFGHMRLLGSGSYTGLLIPEDAVITDQTRKTVMVVGKADKVEPRVLQLGPLVDGLRVVRAGLKPDDRVIIAGVQLARPGMTVTPRMGKVVVPAPGLDPAAPIIALPSKEATAASAAR